MDEQKPGQVINPGQTDTASSEHQANTPAQAPPQELAISQEDAAKYQTPQQFTNQPESDSLQNNGDITWSASEYIAHHKSAGWYGIFSLVACVLLAAIYFITDGDILSMLVVIVVGVVFVMYAARTPKEQQYSISDHGVSIGPKTYSFHDFKSFSVIDEGAFSSIAFMPLKRFMPVISIYYAPEHEAEIIDVLSAHLPFDQRNADAIDRLMKKIRF